MERWQRWLRHRGERRLVLVETTGAETGRRWAQRVMADCPSNQALWVADEPPSLPEAVAWASARRARHWLGRECDLLVWDGWQGNDPDALAALAGSLSAGGLLIWLMPPRADWPSFADPDYPRTGLPTNGYHPFARRLAWCLDGDPAVLTVTPDAPTPAPPQGWDGEGFEPGPTDDQSRAVAAIVRTGEGRRRRPLVLRADRGRGKSHALGDAAARLLQGRRERIVVTAPRFEAVSVLFRAAAAAWPDATWEGHTLCDSERSLRFLPADALLRTRPEAGLVIVDEAAGLPPSVLGAILTGWPRVVYATTVHGYEGTGRGFDVRFRATLDRVAPQWQALSLTEPVRWSASDPLEPLLSRLFLLNAEAAAVVSDASITVRPWNPAESDETTLNQAFGLLTDAHYRTTPADLRQWLDDPEARTWLAWQGRTVVGALWARHEGGLPQALAHEVAEGRRRPRGHLLAQSLATHGGNAEAAIARWWRITRIAVHPECRRTGIGRQLVAAAVDAAGTAGVDLVGTSFGATGMLSAFWEATGMRPLRLGLHRDSSSGEHTLQMARPVSESGRCLVDALASRFAEHWPLLLGFELADLEPGLVLRLTGAWASERPLSEDDRREIRAYANGYRLTALSRLPLIRLTQQPGVAARIATSGEGELWCRRLLQNHDWTRLQQDGICEGRRDGESRLRQQAADLMDWL
ncbi:tRNA(Met)-cytidine N(4)-acetyltransferase [Tamilnaduibacter salinus]|uniref:tRNA(Met) cytidine acetyltransferase TmcA n=1 Tax=Tamilnaduibacter salinus TaxID=1484056 RepID=A0A2A2I2M8_9GAMM|nr:GNAT family N-acetyltransferase [Tamilnaduibacter salinus]PAV25969.1 tRNA cytosine(34) acetyltransferase TmcA [Tamilnaduibacter salinus]PVY76291.1 tRNA(Met)-cytidine N(4)-acetyltransferase [Tamilnaduibacter salinus]